ncbi:hypothetical protein QBC35DRAFT_67657 [Podospora australis]|uniref:Rhodopsin domain-containing protein n=1 Tax=Podospora australis TaxID=1536484 RepID=A0AAN6WMK6_9PEZI|nr:hypothetical protein QBC35DRAFT_67657 [Podospora australis]
MALWPAVQPDLNPSPERLADTTTWMQMSVLSVFFFFTVIFVGLRLYARVVITKSFGKDDVALCLAALCSIGGWSLFLVQSLHGLGRHIETLSFEEGQVFRVCGFFLTMVVSNWGMCSLKTAIGFNLLRFCDDKLWRRYPWVIWGLLGIIWCYTFIYWVFALTHCDPVHRFWDLTAKGTCIPLPKYIKIAMGNTVLATSTDVFLALVPIPVIWRIKHSVKVRMYLIAILSLGYFSVGMGVVKTIYQQKFSSNRDKTYHLNVPFWSFLQLQLGIMAACCVALRPLVHRILGLSSHRSTAGPSNFGNPSGAPLSVGSQRMRDLPRSKDDDLVDEIELEEGHGGVTLHPEDGSRTGGHNIYGIALGVTESEEAILKGGREEVHDRK